MSSSLSKQAPDVDLVVFDLDGTLVDSREDIAAAIGFGIKQVSGPEVPKEEIFPLIGRPLVEMFEQLLPNIMKDRAQEAAQAYRKNYFEHCTDRSRLYPGVMECLKQLEGIPLAIATTKMTFMAVQVIEKLNLSNRFALVHGSDGIPHKPDPTVLRQVLDKLGFDANKSWMIGDTVYDIQAAKAIGMHTCAVTYGIGNANDLHAQKPKLVLDTLAHFKHKLFQC